MFYIVLGIHVVLCLILVALVLLQEGKDIGAAFGAGGSQSLFGAAGIDKPIVRATTTVAVLFMVTSVLLVRMYSAPTMEVGASAGAGLPEELSKAGKAMQAQSEALKAAASAAPAAEAPKSAEGAAAKVDAEKAPSADQKAPKAAPAEEQESSAKAKETK